MRIQTRDVSIHNGMVILFIIWIRYNEDIKVHDTCV